MTLRTRVQTLIPAALLALAIAGVSATQADAKPRRPADNGVRCAIAGSAVGSPNSVEFYVPGERVYVEGSDGHLHVIECGADGNWTVVYLTAPVVRGQVPPLSGGVVARP